MGEYKKLWIALGVVLVASFAVLGGVGYQGIRTGPPTPAQVVSADGSIVFSGEYIKDGQNVWQSIGGQEVGSIWGHGAYVAPDWTASFASRCVGNSRSRSGIWNLVDLSRGGRC